MSYHGYTPLVKRFLYSLPHTPTVLEVGIDRGVTLIPLTAFLAATKKEFVVIGIDVMVQEPLQLTMQGLGLQEQQRLFLIQGNSLEVLPQLVKQQIKFDVLLLDGDHNYHTVSRELEHLEDLTYPHSIVIIDDYEGRWADRDLWYAQRPEYEKNEFVTQPVESEKHGVKPAVDEFLAAHPEWKTARPIPGEPIVLTRAIFDPESEKNYDESQ